MAGQTPQSEQYIPVYTEGQKADLTPQSDHRVNTVNIGSVTEALIKTVQRLKHDSLHDKNGT